MEICNGDDGKPQIVCDRSGHCSVVYCRGRSYPLGCKISDNDNNTDITRPCYRSSERLGSSGGNGVSTVRVVDLRPRLPPAWDQGDTFSCTGQTLAAAVSLISTQPPSALFFYYCARASQGHGIDEDDGCTMVDALKGAELYGYCYQSTWPYVEQKFAQFPPWKAFEMGATNRHQLIFERINRNLNDYLECLQQLRVIITGIIVYESMFLSSTIESGIIPTPVPATEKRMGGHAVSLVGYDLNKGCFILRNSWGEKWGDRGHGYISFDYIMNPELCQPAYTLRPFR